MLHGSSSEGILMRKSEKNEKKKKPGVKGLVAGGMKIPRSTTTTRRAGTTPTVGAIITTTILTTMTMNMMTAPTILVRGAHLGATNEPI